MKHRRRWILFWSLAALLVVVLLVRRYDPPFDGSDLLPIRPFIDPAANAYPLYDDLATRLQASLGRDSLQPLCAILQDPSRCWPYMGDLVRSNEFVFAELDGIQALPFCQAPDLTSFRTDDPNEPKLGNLSSFLSLSTASALQSGQPRQAVRHARQQVTMARHLLQEPENMYMFFIGISVHAKALSSLRTIAADPHSSAGDVRDLLRIAQEEIPSPGSFRLALQGEYKMECKILDIRYAESDDPGRRKICCSRSVTRFMPRWLQGKLFYRYHHTKRMLHDWVQVVVEASHGDRVCPDANRLLKIAMGRTRFWAERRLACWKANHLGDIYVSSFNYFATNFLEWQAHRAQQALTQVFLASYLYLKERGSFPSSLNDLCPNWLAEIPLDPFDGSPVHFDPDLPAVFSSWPVNEHGQPSDTSNLASLPPLTKADRDNGSTVLLLFPPPDPTPRSVSEIRKSRRPR